MDRRHISSLGLLVATGSVALLLGACGSMTDISSSVRTLTACTSAGTPFATDPFPWSQTTKTWAPDIAWKEQYHATVDRLVEERLRQLGLTGEVAEPVALRCAAEDSRLIAPASQLLRDLAATLPPWEKTNVDEELSGRDLPIVLMEYLRTYECALKEHVLRAKEEIAASRPPRSLLFNVLLDEERRRSKALEREITVARAAMERALTLLSGFDRLDPIHNDLTCLARASLDLRNVLGLAAEAASCMSERLPGARGSVRFHPL